MVLIYFAIDQVKQRTQQITQVLMSGIDRINEEVGRFRVTCRGLDSQSHINTQKIEWFGLLDDCNFCATSEIWLGLILFCRRI